jgi:hypothetical protein
MVLPELLLEVGDGREFGRAAYRGVLVSPLLFRRSNMTWLTMPIGRLSAGIRPAQDGPKGGPERAKVHDFVDRELGKVTPYGWTALLRCGQGQPGHHARYARVREYARRREWKPIMILKSVCVAIRTDNLLS